MTSRGSPSAGRGPTPPPRGSTAARVVRWCRTWLGRPALLLLVTGALGWWMLRLPTRERAEPPPVEAEPPPPPAPVPPRAWQPRPAVAPAPGCAPQAERRCVDGDAWWVDGCGVTYAKAEECGATRCHAGACEPPPPGCGAIPLPGRCEGDVAEVCAADRPSRVDCAALGLRCVDTPEGPACRPAAAEACDPAAEPPRCDGTVLVTCTEGERQRLDCGTRGAICGRPPGGVPPAACLQLRPPVPTPACEDPCGCPPEPGEEVCNGLDDDADGFVDESGSCPPLELVLFVIVDDDGQGSHAPEDVDEELARLQRLFAREDDFGLEVRVADVVRVAEPAWRVLDGDDLEAMIRSPTVTRHREAFYVPVVLTDEVIVDGVPRPGLSTVPNGSCGGQRRVQGPQPLLGLVAVAKQRWPTTLAHELGHFLGLCHTHGDHPAPVIALDPGASGSVDEAQACVEPCSREGDGICDTPPDPGPGPCQSDAECLVACGDGSTPDATNLMGYYPECRTGFTAAQAQLMRRTLALRHDWQRCAGEGGCACEVGDGTCPAQMSCHRFQGAEGPYQRCVLDGPVVPGGVCQSSLECAAESQCIGQDDVPESRCVRPCAERTAGCRCEAVEGVPHPICMEDLGIVDG